VLLPESAMVKLSPLVLLLALSFFFEHLLPLCHAEVLPTRPTGSTRTTGSS
jgi:hypothetical protein